MGEELKKAERLFNEGRAEEALEAVNLLLKNETEELEYLLLRVKINYRLQKWGEALNDLNHILDKDPNNQAASNYKTMVLEIISFWNKDSFNP